LETTENRQSEIRRSSENGHNRRVRAVLFDLGETLLTFGKIDTARIFAVGARSSYEYLKSLNVPICGFGRYFWKNLVNLRIQRWISDLKGRDFDALAMLEKVGTKKGLKLSKEQWRDLAWTWYEPLGRMGRIEPDAKETLTALKESGLKLGIVSNTFVHGSSLEKHLRQFGILDFFTMRMYSYEFAFRKPDARIFKIAAERIGEPAENIVFVGDRINKDIEPAIAGGMVAVLKDAYTNAGKATPAGARRINHISELPGLISQINAELVAAR